MPAKKRIKVLLNQILWRFRLQPATLYAVKPKYRLNIFIFLFEKSDYLVAFLFVWLLKPGCNPQGKK